MHRFKIFIIVSTIILLMSCNIKTATDTDKKDNQQTQDYIINENLSLNDYSDVKGYFPEDGFVPTAEIAFQIAEPILCQIYGKEKIEREKPFSINLENDIWMVEGSIEKGFDGGVAYIELRKSNGEILKVIHTK